MCSFSRGCFLAQQWAFRTPRTLRVFSISKSFQQPRAFSSGIVFQALKKARPLPALRRASPTNKPAFSPNKSPALTPPPSIYQPFASTLAQKSHPTILYEAPSHTLFIVSSYAGAIFCFGYATFTFWSNYLHAPAGLSTWVPIAFSGICFLMAALGTWVLLGPSRLVRTITALPQTSTAATAAGTSLTRAVPPKLMIEVELRKMFPLPFFPARKIYARPDELVLRMPLAPVDNKGLTPAEMRVARQQEEEETARLLAYERGHVMSAPFRHANRAFFNLFRAVGRTWTREGFLKLGVKGRIYKLDITGGWALDGGRAVDRLATIKPNL
jgi:hypothetical protein